MILEILDLKIMESIGLQMSYSQTKSGAGQRRFFIFH